MPSLFGRAVLFVGDEVSLFGEGVEQKVFVSFRPPSQEGARHDVPSHLGDLQSQGQGVQLANALKRVGGVVEGNVGAVEQLPGKGAGVNNKSFSIAYSESLVNWNVQ